MNAEKLRERIRNLKVWKQFGQRAPHKPLLILYALGRLKNQQSRLLVYSEIEEDLKKLLERFGPRRKNQHADEPFKRLPGDRLWELSTPSELAEDRTHFTSYQMRKFEVKGGFPVEIFDLLTAEPELIEEIVRFLLEQNWVASYHDEIRRSVGLELTATVESNKSSLLASIAGEEHTKRDPRFRDDVLRAYSRNCCVCGSDLRLEDSLFDLEAAHIMWHAHGGPDEVPNGLALCGFHHKAFDRGVWGLKQNESEFKVIVSDDLNGQSKSINLLLDFQDQTIRLPKRQELYPDKRFIQWHRDEVFRD